LVQWWSCLPSSGDNALQSDDLRFSKDDGEASIHRDCLELDEAEPDLPLVSSAPLYEWEEVSSTSEPSAEPEWEVLAAVDNCDLCRGMLAIASNFEYN
jgi:hypothetical protein